MFDWGAKDSMELMINGEINFDNAYEKITRPGLKDTYELFEKKILSGQNYKKAFVFLDNSGADTILGVLPFARELLMRFPFFFFLSFFLLKITLLIKFDKNKK